MTAEFPIRRVYSVEPGRPVLLHAAAGGVGLLACQWLAHRGAELIGTVRAREKAEVAAAHGCAHTIVHTEEDVVQRVRAITAGGGVPIACDSVGKATFEISLDCLARRGMLVAYGNASGSPEPLDVVKSVAVRVEIRHTCPSRRPRTRTEPSNRVGRRSGPAS